VRKEIRDTADTLYYTEIEKIKLLTIPHPFKYTKRAIAIGATAGAVGGVIAEHRIKPKPKSSPQSNSNSIINLNVDYYIKGMATIAFTCSGISYGALIGLITDLIIPKRKYEINGKLEHFEIFVKALK